jgi:ABC-type Fe3+-hydroxamate transport system substrate-binding protein
MKKMLKVAFTMAVATFFIGCASALPTVTGVVSKENSGKKVTASVDNMNWFGAFTPMSIEKAEEAAQKLSSQCGGDVVNVTSHWKTKNLLVLPWVTETLTVSGYCK